MHNDDAFLCNTVLHNTVHEKIHYIKIRSITCVLHIFMSFNSKIEVNITSITHILQQLHILHIFYSCIIHFTS